MKVKTIKEKIKEYLIAEEHTFTETQEGLTFNYENAALEINIMENVGFELSFAFPFQVDTDDLETWSNLLCFIREKYKQSSNSVIKYDASGKLSAAVFVHCQVVFLRKDAISKAIQTLQKTMRIYETGLHSIICEDADPIDMIGVCLKEQIEEDMKELMLAIRENEADEIITNSEEDMPNGGKWFMFPEDYK